MGKSARDKLAKSWAPLFYEHVYTQIDESPFAVLFKSTGAPNAPVNTLLSLEIIKHMKDITDSELIDRYNFDYLVNYAAGQRVLGEDPIAERTLYYFRERLYIYTTEHPEGEDLMFRQFKHLPEQFASKTGHIMNARRIDSTMFMSNIKKSGRMSPAYDVLMRSLKKIPGEARTEGLRGAAAPNFKSELLYKTKSGEAESRLSRLLTLCREALAILNKLPETEAAEEKRIIERLLNEQTQTAEDGTITVKPNKEISSGSLQSAYDEDATYRTKNKVSQSGYVLSVTETCAKDNPMQFITDYQVEANITADTTILAERMDKTAETGCEDLYGDGGYYSDEVAAQAEESGIAMHYTDMTGREPQNEITAGDFQLNESRDTIELCPGGQKPERTGETKKDVTAHFKKSTCAKCAHREQCPHKEQKADTVVRLSKKTINARAQRQRINAERRDNTSFRAAIEGTNSALKQKGLKKLRVRGKAKCAIVCGLKVIAQNVKRFIKYMQGGYDRAAIPAV
jgi:hypothetical protein